MKFEPASAGTLLRQTVGLLKVSPLSSIFACAALAAVGTAADILDPDGFRLIIIDFLVFFVLQFVVTLLLLSRLGLVQPGHRSRQFLAMVGLALLSWVAIFLGFLLLLVPGLVLAVRWFTAVPVLIGEDVGAVEALQRSWDETSGWFSPIMVVFVAIQGPMVLAIGIMVMFYDAWEGVAWGIAALTNVIMAASSILSWHAAVAIYAHVRNPTRLAEVFA